ncbi:MAG: hypothetical protein ACP8RL_08235 [cyanobacterium endosymbiont of Rhopalodia inflata]
MKKTSCEIVRIRLTAVLLVGSIGVFIGTFLVSPVQENKSAVLSLEFPSSIPLFKLH